MEYVRLGKSNLMISRVAMGISSLEKLCSDSKSYELVRTAYEQGINFFDTSRKVPDCEKLLGEALGDIRENVIIATKTNAQSGSEVLSDFEESLNSMRCDAIELFQYETDSFLPEKNGVDGIFSSLTRLKDEGKCRAIGISTQNLDVAEKAISSGLYDTIQFPFSMISSEKTIALVKLCEENDMGFVAMQPLCGGVVDNIPLAFGFLRQYENVIPLWGVKTADELKQILYFNEHPPVIDEKFKEDVERFRMFFN